jgi:hypothetical protein
VNGPSAKSNTPWTSKNPCLNLKADVAQRLTVAYAPRYKMHGMVVETLLIAIYLHRKMTSIYPRNLPSLRSSPPAGPCLAEPSAVSIQLSLLLPCVAKPVTSRRIATEARVTRNRSATLAAAAPSGVIFGVGEVSFPNTILGN